VAFLKAGVFGPPSKKFLNLLSSSNALLGMSTGNRFTQPGTLLFLQHYQLAAKTNVVERLFSLLYAWVLSSNA
jgi:hypothetical protein